MPTPHFPPRAARKALSDLGADIREARLRRDLSMAMVAERAMTSRSTLQRVERGDHTVGIGIYAAVLHVLGLADRLAAVADPVADETGRLLDTARLPTRARTRRP